MSVPDYQSLMRPLLELASETPLHVREAADQIANQLQLSEEDLELLLPSGSTTRYLNRINWAKTYLKQAGLLSYPSRAHFAITEDGKEFLARHSGPIGNSDLKAYESFRDFQSRKNDHDGAADKIPSSTGEPDQSETPDEQIASLHAALNDELAVELIERVQNMPPVFFERLLVKLLVKMGYGGTSDEAGRDLGKSGDGGVDGVIDQDRLGVDQV